MYPSKEKLKTILVKGNYISDADDAAANANSKDGDAYVRYLIEQELLTETLLGQAIAEYYKLPFADLRAKPPTKDTLSLLPEQVARDFRVVVVQANDKAIAIATDQPENKDLKKLRDLLPQKKIGLAYTLPLYVTESFELYIQPLETRFSAILERGGRIAPEIVDEIIKDAVTYHASDIHFEPQIDTVIIRFRIDGTLRQAGELPKEQYENILNRIKVESGMRIDEHMTSQDGAMQRKSQSYITDLRVSLIPTVQGEKIVMRVLSSYVQGFELADLGLDDAHRKALETYAKKPFGMILTVGPTGSGKTTTLYALLKMLNEPRVNITTIEDPVEYKMPGINQIQVRAQSKMTFSNGLRSIVRQDPDIILVGEIRDSETAEIGVNAALTGHLLLSTFHSNDAATAVPRLVDMGIEPFLLASTLEVVIAQRLVRKICDNCRHSVPTATVIQGLRTNRSVSNYLKGVQTLYVGKGCPVCSGSGYRGRIAVYEFLEVTPEIQDLIAQSPTAGQIWQLATKQGAQSMFENGIEKVKNGVTTLEELTRVVEPPKGEGRPNHA